MLKSVLLHASVCSLRVLPDQGLREITKRAGVLFMGSSALWKAAVGKTIGEQGGEQESTRSRGIGRVEPA